MLSMTYGGALRNQAGTAASTSVRSIGTIDLKTDLEQMSAQNISRCTIWSKK